MEIEERFWSKVDHNVHEPDRCWPWLTDSRDSKGYGHFWLTDSQGKGTMVKAHRLAYELEEGPIPEGFQVDHLCHDPKKCKGGITCPHRRCCNPAHMKLVTNEENCAPHRKVQHFVGKTHCPRGHEYSGTNSRGARICRTCSNELKRLRRRKK